MKTQPLVSVIMPVYNSGKFVAEAIQSILDQTYPHFEFIIINDGSTDNSWSVIQKSAQKDKRIRVYQNPRNLGIVISRNRGFKLASGRYFAIMDSDDISLPKRLEKEIEFLEKNPDYAVVGSQIEIIDESSKVIAHRRYPTTFNQIAKVITRQNPLAQSTVLVKRSALKSVGFYRQGCAPCEDYDLWLRLAMNGSKLGNLDEYLVRYRLSPQQQKKQNFRLSLKNTLAIQRAWLLEPKFFRLANLLYHLTSYLILPLPSSLGLWLFKQAAYAKQK